MSSPSTHRKQTSVAMRAPVFALFLLSATLPCLLATEVLLNSGSSMESASTASLSSTAAEILKLTTAASESSTTAKPPSPSADSNTNTNAESLDLAETKDPTKKLEIIKQIRKINQDGSYTVGYEAGDGTFKIESRDVLGNIKGTYGYVDSNGEIKRVSYNGQNGTSALKTFPRELEASGNALEDAAAPEELSTTLPNANASPPPPRTPLRAMRRPAALKFLSTTTSATPTRSNYIQAIPKRRLGIPSSTERSQYSHRHPQEVAASSTPAPVVLHSQTTHEEEEGEDQPTTATTLVYAKTVPTQKPMIILRPTTTQATSSSSGGGGRAQEQQISRPEKLEIIQQPSKVKVTRPSEEREREREKDRKSVRGNNLRRQTVSEREDHYEAQPQQLYAHNAGEDTAHIYDGTAGNLRPLYNTNSRPRVPSIVLAARQRAAQLQNALNGNQAPTTTTEKVYVRPPPAAAVQYETTTSEPTQETNYLTQAPSGTVVQIPASQGIAQQATEDQGSIYGQRPAPFMLRQPGAFAGTEAPQGNPFRFPPPPSARGDQYLRETTPATAKLHHQHREDADEPSYSRNLPQRQRAGGANYDGEANYQQGSFPVPFQQPLPYGGGFGAAYPGAYNFPQRPPVTTRDFEMLLQILQTRNRFGGAPGFGYGGYGGAYNPNIGPYLGNPYQGLQQYPRSQLYDPVGFDPRYQGGFQGNFGGFRQYSEPQSNVYQGSGQTQASQNPSGSDQGQFNDQRGILRQPQGRFTSSSGSYYGANSSPSVGVNPYQQPAQHGQHQSAQLGRGVAPYYQPDFSNVQQSYATQASTQQDYLPVEVREDLLYRMLMLAIQNPSGGFDAQQTPLAQQPPQIGAFSDPVKSVVNTGVEAGTGHPQHHQHHHQHLSPLGRINANSLAQMGTRKPVRSVQIIGEAEE